MNYVHQPMLNSVPAAHELRNVTGFDPLKFLRRVTTETGERVLKLELPYKRLWFRLACPNGRMVVKPLRITDQMAVFEALVFAEKDDPEPLARFSASVTPQDTPDGKYVEAAQDCALNTALENAGFGVQLCDFVQSSGGRRYGSEVSEKAIREAQTAAKEAPPKPAPTAAKEKPVIKQAPVVVEAHQDTAQRQVQPVAVAAKPAEKKAVSSSPEQQPMPMSPAREAKVEQPAPVVAETAETAVTQPEPANETDAVKALMSQSQPKAAPAVEPKAEPVDEAPSASPAALGYTADMTVDEICQHMPLEDARSYVVQGGVCKGWTLAQVAERRAPSLRFYVCANTSDNILKAAAKLVLEDMEKNKAG